jgi:hypothetical protein
MRPLFLIAIMAFGITTVQAQTTSTGGNQVGSDPLSVPTSSLPKGSSSSTGSISAGTANGSTTATGSFGASAGATGGNSASGITASSSNTSQVPLQLPGEAPNTSSQAATSTAGAASHSSSSTVCPPSVPTSDGGSANLTDMVGGSLNGC